MAKRDWFPSAKHKGTSAFSFRHVQQGLAPEPEPELERTKREPLFLEAYVSRGYDDHVRAWYQEQQRQRSTINRERLKNKQPLMERDNEWQAFFKLVSKCERLERDRRKGKVFVPLAQREAAKLPPPEEPPIPRYDPAPIERKGKWSSVPKKRARPKDRIVEPWGNSSLSGRKQPGSAGDPVSSRWKYVSSDRKLP